MSASPLALTQLAGTRARHRQWGCGGTKAYVQILQNLDDGQGGAGQDTFLSLLFINESLVAIERLAIVASQTLHILGNIHLGTWMGNIEFALICRAGSMMYEGGLRC